MRISADPVQIRSHAQKFFDKVQKGQVDGTGAGSMFAGPGAYRLLAMSQTSGAYVLRSAHATACCVPCR